MGMDSSYCCACAGTCNHTGPHIYCNRHGGAHRRHNLESIPPPCPSCATLRAELQHEKDAMQPYFASIRGLEKENATLHAEVAALKEDFRQRFLLYRNVDEPCKKCGGSGAYVYPNTTTWGGGCGGQSMTNDVCDKCWGTGDIHRTGANLKKIRAEHDQLKSDLALLRERVGDVISMAI